VTYFEKGISMKLFVQYWRKPMKIYEMFKQMYGAGAVSRPSVF
jgi:hypothetical protein